MFIHHPNSILGGLQKTRRSERIQKEGNDSCFSPEDETEISQLHFQVRTFSSHTAPALGGWLQIHELQTMLLAYFAKLLYFIFYHVRTYTSSCPLIYFSTLQSSTDSLAQKWHFKYIHKTQLALCLRPGHPAKKSSSHVPPWCPKFVVKFVGPLKCLDLGQGGKCCMHNNGHLKFVRN